MLESKENENRFQDFMKELTSSSATTLSQEFYENPVPILKKRGITIIPSAVASPHYDSHIRKMAISIPALSASGAAAAPNESERLWVVMHWWGPEFFMNEKLTQDIIMGVEMIGAVEVLVVGALAAAGGVPGAIAAAMGVVISTVVAAKTFELKVVDNGNGISFPVSWAQWALIVGAAPPSPPSIAVAMGVIHPIRQ